MKKNLFISIGILTLWLMGCAPREAPFSAGLAPSPVEEVKPEVREAWQIEWDKTLQSAKKEGKVVVYAATPAPALKEAISLFRKKFALDLEVLAARGPELTPRVLQEKASGLHIVDVMMAGPATILRGVKTAGTTVPLEPVLILPEVRDPKAWVGGELPWIDKERHAFAIYLYPSKMLAINTELVRPGDINSYYDLIDPRWKDKIIIYDPTVSGSGSNGANSLIVNKVVDWDFFRKLVSMQNMMTRSGRLQVEWLARGKYPAALWPHSSELAEFIKAGAPIAPIGVKEGTYLSADGAVTVLMDRAPHPNTARVFVNWLLSREVQTLMQDFLLMQSARVDISTQKLEPLSTRTEGEIYFRAANADEQWVLHEQQRYYDIIAKVFAPLLK